MQNRRAARRSIAAAALLALAAWAAPGAASDAIRAPLSTDDGRIVDALGAPVALKGVNWFGLESKTFSPHGLWRRNWRQMMLQMRDLGFNTIRLPFSVELLYGVDLANGVDHGRNPDLAGLTGLEVMDRVARYAGELGIGVILDNHRLAAGDGAETGGLWRSHGVSEAEWVAGWRFLARRYRGWPGVIGADLFNEPHGAARWGGGGADDWRRAAERAGAAIQAANPDWLIIVQGVARAGGSHYWNGGNLAGAARDPVRLPLPNKLVYSAHLYPASVYPQPWLRGPGFERDLETVWRRHWGYLLESGDAPVLIGEFGARMSAPGDRVWLAKLTRFLERPSMAGRVAWTYWSWNPNSHDTGGLLHDDWRTPAAHRLGALAALLRVRPPPPPVAALPRQTPPPG